MKKRNAKKLSLKKDTLSHLSRNHQQQIQGGAFSFNCPTPRTRCFICPPRTFDGQCTIVI
jgi:hypothetical protein